MMEIWKIMETVVKIKCAGWEMDVSVNSEDFDDIYVEACTRALEHNVKSSNVCVAPFMEATANKKMYIYNSYKILANAGFYTYAENLRKNVKRKMSVDLKNEPIRG
jgi:hypothetical protein